MSTIKSRRGLNVPIHGAASSLDVHTTPATSHVALLPQESWGIKVKMLAQVGDAVKLGTPLFCDRRDEAAVFGSPGAGKLVAVNRGHRRSVLSVVIELDHREEHEDFQVCDPSKTSAEDLRKALLYSGLWPVLRQRPYDKVANSEAQPSALIVTASDTRPLAPSPLAVIAGRETEFKYGLAVLAKLCGAPTWLCHAAGEDWNHLLSEGVRAQGFGGPHPSGTAGYQIHKLAPVGPQRSTWHVGYQDVADVGQLFMTGKQPTERVIALVGPVMREPRLLRTRRGADLAPLCKGEYEAAQPRVVSGSLLEGMICEPGSATGYLGRYANQVSIMEGRTDRELLGWVKPVAGRFTQTNTLLDKFFRSRFKFDADANGGLRAIVPAGMYEKVMPLDILPTQLIKALASNDLENAEKLGVLEIAEEDLALCQFVDPSKQPLTDMLRTMLTRIEKEG
ncbi:MAG: Na+-transporting NADH:ubiquinone oxidoreductase subunit A [Planctomycetota bacterium]|jgi:Na+-transporting NADH:ubiquinone oxidoreductase subunit A